MNLSSLYIVSVCLCVCLLSSAEQLWATVSLRSNKVAALTYSIACGRPVSREFCPSPVCCKKAHTWICEVHRSCLWFVYPGRESLSWDTLESQGMSGRRRVALRLLNHTKRLIHTHPHTLTHTHAHNYEHTLELIWRVPRQLYYARKMDMTDTIGTINT